MRHLSGEVELLQRGDAVAAANHHGGARLRLLGGELGELARCRAERRDLKDAEWPVPKDRLHWPKCIAHRVD